MVLKIIKEDFSPINTELINILKKENKDYFLAVFQKLIVISCIFATICCILKIYIRYNNNDKFSDIYPDVSIMTFFCQTVILQFCTYFLFISPK